MNCAPKVQSALRNVPGVESVEADFEEKTATVTCRGECDTSALIAALQKAGYDGRVK